MAFEVYEGRPGGARMEVGRVSLDVNGTLRFTAADAAAAAIDNEAMVLIDRATKRIAIRGPRSDEKGKAVKWDEAETTGQIYLGGALGKIGLAKDAVKGRHDVEIKDGMLVLNLMPAGRAR